MENSTKYKVAVKCCTYNQAQYITDALNGFVMQETDFPFVCCIIDDASTDGEQEVIRKYVSENFDLSEPDVAYEKETDDAYITYARHKSNKNCFFAVLYLKVNLYKNTAKKYGLVSEYEKSAQYLAMCEGDDYWIDAKKLQKQVEILDENIDTCICYTSFDIKYEETGKVIQDAPKVYPSKYPMRYETVEDFILAKPYVCPPSWLYRKDVYESYVPIPNSCDGSFCMFAFFMSKSNVAYLDYVTSVYRVVPESASHSTSSSESLRRRKQLLELQKQLIDRYRLPQMLKYKCESRFYYDNLVFFAENGYVKELEEAKCALVGHTARVWLYMGVGKSVVLSNLLLGIHQLHRRLRGYKR